MSDWNIGVGLANRESKDKPPEDPQPRRKSSPRVVLLILVMTDFAAFIALITTAGHSPAWLLVGAGALLLAILVYFCVMLAINRRT